MELKKIKILGVLILFFLFYGCQKKNQFVKSDKKSTPEVANFTLIHINRGKKVWELVAKKAVIDEVGNKIKVVDGSIKFFDKDSYISKMSFYESVIDTKSNEIEFISENVINTVENEKIITYNTKYNSSEQRAYSEEDVVVYRQEGVIKGKGFETRDGFRTITINTSPL